MFGIGIYELFFVMLIVLLVFGPEKLPEMARNLGSLAATLKRTGDSIRKEFYNSLYPPARSANEQIASAREEFLGLTKSEETQPGSSAQEENGKKRPESPGKADDTV